MSLVVDSDVAGAAFASALEVEEESEAVDDVLLECDAEPLRLSVAYQPEPLKITPAGYSTRRTLAPHLGQSLIGSS